MRDGWEVKQLGEVYDVRDGTHDSPKYHATGYPLITSKNLKPAGLSFHDVSFISELDYKKINERSAVHKGDVLFAMIGTIGNPTLVIIQPSFAIKNVALFKIPNNQCGQFLKYYLETEWVISKMIIEAKGTTQKFVGLGYLRNFPILLPPLPEQQRIVGILDEAFAGIATAKANAEKNLQNARALFESHLQAVFSQRGEGWAELRLSEVAETIATGPFGTMLHKSDYVPDGIPLVNPMNIIDSKIVPSSKMMVNEATKNRLGSYILKVGDIVVGRRGELGRCAIVTQREAGWLCGTGSFFIRLTEQMDGEFFVALFGSKQFKARLEASAVGTTMSSLNHSILNELSLPVPPIATQRQIIKIVHQILEETQRLESIYQQKIAVLDELKKSLLHKAFSGELTIDN